MGNGHKSFILWFTGLSGAGKSTIADIVYNRIMEKGLKAERLDGDVLRGVFPSTGFTKEARDEHIKRVGYMASRLEKHGVIVVCSFISPYASTRDFVRNMCDDFVEIYVKASLEECERRDVKGLYRKARGGQIRDFTGIDAPYEEPESPEIVIDTVRESIEESAGVIIGFIEKKLSGDSLGSS